MNEDDMNDLYLKRKDTILNALIERNGIQYLADTAARVLNNPLFLYDLSGKILAKKVLSGCEGDGRLMAYSRLLGIDF